MKQKGITKFYQDIDVSLMDVFTIIFSWAGDTKKMGVYRKEEFTRAFNELGVSSVEELKNNKNKIRKSFTENFDEFKKVYRFAFVYAAMGKKELPKQTACVILTVLLKDKYPLSEEFLKYLKDVVSVL